MDTVSGGKMSCQIFSTVATIALRFLSDSDNLWPVRLYKNPFKMQICWSRSWYLAYIHDQ